MVIEAREAKEAGGKVVLVPFNFPPEILHSFKNVTFLTSEILTTLGVVGLEGQGERYWDYAMGLGIPDFLCSANTIALGSILSGEDFIPDAIIQMAPGSCDANSKIHEFVARYHGIPQFFVEKPTDSGRRGREQYEKYFRAFLDQLQEYLEEELDEKWMREVANKSNRCTELYYELWDLHKHVPCPVPNLFSLFTYATRFTIWGTDEGIEQLELMIETVKGIMERGEYPAPERARSLWTYLPYYFDFMGFFDWLERQGIVYLDDILTLCFPSPIDTTDKDSIINGLAEAAWNMPMTRQMGGDAISARWLDDITYAVNELGANCAIYCGHHSCKQTWSVFASVRNEIQKRTGVPTLCLQGDSWMRNMTPTSVLQEEISHFVDSVVDKKRRRTRRKTESTE
jgi:benzoyl-CoA reductase/2-hydroxyglutaryl-CoA dehydratase subunit BcrC/BadD/HgdB